MKGNQHQLVTKLTPLPDPVGVYGYIEWQALWDWWRPRERTILPHITGTVLPHIDVHLRPQLDITWPLPSRPIVSG